MKVFISVLYNKRVNVYKVKEVFCNLFIVELRIKEGVVEHIAYYS